MYKEETAKYLGNIIRHSLNGEPLEMLPDETEIVELYRIARANQIDCMVGKALLEMNILNEADAAAVHGRCVKLLLHSATQLNELTQIQNAFEENEIKNLPLKGSRMKAYYKSPELRQMSDLDICVEEIELQRVQKVMEQLGYTLKESIANHDVYGKKPFMEVEIHRCLFKQEVDKKQHDYFGSFEKAIIDEGKQYCYHQSLEDYYVYMIAHMAGHFYERGCGIRNLIDIHVFLQNFKEALDLKYIQSELEVCGLKDFEAHMRTLTEMWLHEKKIEDPFYQNLFGYMTNCGIYGKEEYGIWNEYARQKKREGQKNAKYMKLWYIFPPVHYMQKDFPVLKKYPILLPFLWVFRIVRGLVCKRGVERREYLNQVGKEDIGILQTIYEKMNFDFCEMKQ